MEHPGLFIAVALVADGLAGLTGGLLSEPWLQRRRAALVGFAAGALLAAAFLDVLPEAIESLGRTALTVAFAGFVALAVLEWLLGSHHHQEARSGPPLLPLALLSSDALHNVADGAAVAAAFLVSFEAGLSVSLAVIAHEIPQEVGDYALLRAAGWRRASALSALAVVQLTAVAGAIGVVLVAAHFHRASAFVLALSAGSFLYISATDLLPEIHSGRTGAERRERMLGLLCGIALIVLASAFESPL